MPDVRPRAAGRWFGTPRSTALWRRLTAQRGPAKEARRKLRHTAAPTLPRRVEAPITAAEAGSNRSSRWRLLEGVGRDRTGPPAPAPAAAAPRPLGLVHRSLAFEGDHPDHLRPGLQVVPRFHVPLERQVERQVGRLRGRALPATLAMQRSCGFASQVRGA
jgi:hypothetical protein